MTETTIDSPTTPDTEVGNENYQSIWGYLRELEFRQGFLDVDGVRTRYVEAGSPDKPHVILLHGTPFFSLGAFATAVLLLMHHTIIHYRSEFTDERCSCAPFQCKDVGNHETWVVASVTAGLVSLFQL